MPSTFSTMNSQAAIRGVVAVTTRHWFQHLRSISPLDEVNFWRPTATPVTEPTGTPWFFKAKSPVNAIVGGGFFTHYSAMPLLIAWDAFGQKNGAPTYQALTGLIVGSRKSPQNAFGGAIGCMVLSQRYFFA